jgi:hypothetical protein
MTAMRIESMVVVVVDEKIPYDRQSLCSRVGDDEKFCSRRAGR